jgi:thiol-disulfide isomerase/thioredoxin
MATVSDQASSSVPPPSARRRFRKPIFWIVLLLSLAVLTHLGEGKLPDASKFNVFMVRVPISAALFGCLLIVGWTLIRLHIAAYRRGYGMFILWTALVLPWGVLAIAGKNFEDASFTLIMLYLLVRAALFASVLVAGWTVSRLICGERISAVLSFPTAKTKGKLGSSCVVAAVLLLPIHLAFFLGLQAVTPGWPAGKLDESILWHFLRAPDEKYDRPGQQLMVAVGQTVDIAGPTVEGGSFDLAEQRGKVVLVDFWATWCGACIAELPNIQKAHDEFHKHGLEVVSVSLDNDPSAVMSFLKDHRLPWPQIYMGGGWKTPLATRYGVRSIPRLLVVSKGGKLITADAHGRRIRTAAAEALGLPAPSQWSDALEECGGGLWGTVVAGFLFSPWWLVVVCGLGAAVVGAVGEVLLRTALKP